MEAKDMAKKSVRARLPVKNKDTPAVSKNQKTQEQLKQSQSLPVVGIGASAGGLESFKRLAENAPDVIFRVDRNLRFIFVNKKISDLTGIPMEQFYGKTLLELGLPKDVCIYLGQKTQEVFDHHTLSEFEFTFNGPRGLRWFHARIVPEFDIHGEVETVLGIAHDVTNLKQAEHAYREEYALRKSIEESLMVGIAAVDREGRQTYVNPSFCKMVGWSKEELLGAKPPFVYWPSEETKSIQESFKAILSSEESSGTLELRFQRKNGKRFDALVLYSPLKDGQGNVIGWIGSIGDITEHKKKDEEIQKLNRELEQRVIERTAELQRVNQELRTKLVELEQTQEKLRESEERFRTAIRNSSITVFQQDRDLRFTWVYNPFPNLNPEDFIGKTDFELASHQEASQLTKIKRQVLKSAEGVRWETQTTINGEVHYFDLTIEPLRDLDGNITGVTCVSVDITDRKKMEDQLMKAQDTAIKERWRLETILHTIPSGVVIIEKPDGRITYMNRRGLELYGRKPAEGLTMEDHSLELKLFKPDGEPFPSKRLPTSRAMIKGEVVRNVEVMIEHPSGQRITVLANASPLRNDAAEIIGSVGSFIDITEYKQAEEQIKRLNEDLKRQTAELKMANKELEAFTYSVSHDLKAPLFVAGGFCRRLSERYGEKLDDKGSHYLQRIQEACQHMNLLIEDLLNLSKATTSEIKFKSIDLSELVKSLAAQLKETQPRRNVKFVIEEGLTAKGDSRLLKIALENLLGNAWKYTVKCEQAKIEFRSIKTTGNERIYSVRDNGCGFDMSMADKLFKPFQRLHSDEEFSGTGVGLATAHRIITRHGGRIWAESELGKGTTFFFTLPS
jgi:PAS domain S-box-containing protein